MNKRLINFDRQFLRRIKTRIALSFSLLFFIFVIPIIIYAFHQVNIFFEGTYLQQMKTAGSTAAAILSDRDRVDYDSLTANISRITESRVLLYSPRGEILSIHESASPLDTSVSLSFPILKVDFDTAGSSENSRHKFVMRGQHRFLKVQSELAGGYKLLQIRSLDRATMLARRMREVIIWSSFLGLIALIAVAFWVSAQISRPIEQLTAFAEEIRTGKLPARVNIKSPDEVGDLAETLNNIVADLDASRKRLGRLETMRRDFFANVRDELERPLQEITAEIDKLDNSPSLAPSQRNSLSQARSQAHRLQEIIRSLMQIAQLEFGGATLELKTVSVNTMIESVVKEFRNRIAAKGLALELKFPSVPEASAIGDERLLKVVLQNLIANALDFTEKGHIRIWLEDEGDYRKITVEDTGPGIPAEDIDRIFERFYRVKTEQANGQERAGLGLAIAKHVMIAHGQALEVDSVLGVGSRFSIRLQKVPIST